MNKDKKVISLFSGAMGFDIGLEKAGLSVVLGQEFDKDCLATAKLNHRKVLPGDIRMISVEDILACAEMEKEEPFLVCGGPPCQPFSTAGKRLGIQDPRGSLFRDFVRMIDGIRPRFFVMENVRGIMSSLLEPKNPESDAVIDIVLEEFAKLNYKTVYGIVNAVDYGTPQFRERFILLGSRDNEDIFIPRPTHFQKHQDKKYQWQTLRSAIEDLEDLYGDCGQFSAKRAQYIKLVPEGGNWRSLPIEILPSAMGGAYQSGGGKTGFYRRLAYDEPCPTLVTSPMQKATLMCHPKKNRPLSVQEYARVQQFPDGWIVAGTLTARYRQIGNAVPVGLAEQIGKAILATAEGTAIIKTKRVK